METIFVPHLPQHPLRVCLFEDVKNAPFLRRQLLEGNRDFEYAFLDASVLLSRNHVLAACFRAINDLLNDRLKSRNVHSEIVFSLSSNNNVSIILSPVISVHLWFLQTTDQDISLKVSHLIIYKIAESFRRFGISDDSRSILAIKIGGDASQVETHLKQHVEGEQVPFSDEILIELCDSGRIRKIYRVDLAQKGNADTVRKDAESFVIGSMALKGS